MELYEIMKDNEEMKERHRTYKKIKRISELNGEALRKH